MFFMYEFVCMSVFWTYLQLCIYLCLCNVYMCVVVCICVNLCVFVCICVRICICVGTLEGSVWGCGQSDDSSKERTVELLTSRVDHFVKLISEIYQFCLAHFKVHLASWWPTVMFDLEQPTVGNVTVGLLSLQIDWITCFNTIANIGIKVLDQTKFKWTIFSF